MEDPSYEEELSIESIESNAMDTESQLEELYLKIKQYQSDIMLAKERSDSETLSNSLIRLARVNTAYGRKAAYALYIARNAERAYRRVREHTKLDAINQKNAIGKAESMAYVDGKVEEAFTVYSNVSLLAEQASDTSYRTDTFMKMAQSGLSLIKNDINGRP